jgi:hypothetical protein
MYSTLYSLWLERRETVRDRETKKGTIDRDKIGDRARDRARDRMKYGA